MTYGDYKYILPYPTGTYERSAWTAHQQKLKDMANWISQQKWDHWGTATDQPHGRGFWFGVTENYIAFKEHFGVEE
jgi:hypothetical protein